MWDDNVSTAPGTNQIARFVESHRRERAEKNEPLTSQLLSYNTRVIFMARTFDNL